MQNSGNQSTHKTTIEWLQEVKSSEQKLIGWLQRQYVGEMLAAERISELAYRTPTSTARTIVERIADDERNHSTWIRDLLTTRNIPLPHVTYENTRYWKPMIEDGMLDGAQDFSVVTALGHHAETMRLIRIKALAEDEEIDADIRDTFSRILKDEIFHAAAFAKLSTPEDIANTAEMHQRGLDCLGLVV